MQAYDVAYGTIAFEVLEASEAGADAPPLTLFHNFMSTGRAAWGALLPLLNRHFRILLPDMPGHGHSLGHPPAWHHTLIARDMAALMQATGFAESARLVGCSSGGMIAQLVIHNRWMRPTALGLVSTTWSTDTRRTGAPLSLAPEDFRASRTWMEATARLHDPWQGEGYFQNVLLPGFRALTPETSVDLALDDLAAFSMPVCVIHGEEDEIFPVKIAREMAAALPHAELHILHGQTHALIFRQPAKVARILDDFLTHVDGRPRS